MDIESLHASQQSMLDGQSAHSVSTSIDVNETIVEPHRIEDELIAMIMKYRDIAQQFFSIQEREQDRSNLHDLYEQLQNLHQKILDSRCYFQLGKTQQTQTERFLLDDTKPEQRLAMVSYVLRTLCKPVILLSGKATLLIAHKRKEKPVKILEDEAAEIAKQRAKAWKPVCKPEDITPEDIDKMKAEITALFQESEDWLVKQKMTFQQADILSQMAASGQIAIEKTTSNPDLLGITTSVILKQES